MKSIKDDFCGYLEIENNKYTYNISNDLVTVLPAQSESRRIYESFCYLMTHNTDVPEGFICTFLCISFLRESSTSL